MYHILISYAFWASNFYIRRKKLFIYHRGMADIVQRLLSLMDEEDAFWSLIGIAKAFNHFYLFEGD